MEWIISLVSDLVIIAFDIILYVRLTPLRKENWITYTIIGVGSAFIISAYTVATYYFNVPYSIASLLCMTLPSIVMFFLLSKYKNARFLVTFCFVDTTSLIIAAFAKVATLLGGLVGSIVSLVLLVIIAVVILISLWGYCGDYRQLLHDVPKGYGSMAISCVLIYALLVFTAGYPAPLITRPEAIPAYLATCVTIISFYAVFILLLREKARLTKANEQLKLSQHWKQMAYVDELTQLGNKAAYDDVVKEIENNHDKNANYYLIYFDVDELKYVNDHFGHLIGDKALKDTVNLFKNTFNNEHYALFRIGGDEFVAICFNVEESEIKKNVHKINETSPHSKYGYSCSCGYARVDFSKKEPFKDVLNIADEKMYLIKSSKKH